MQPACHQKNMPPPGNKSDGEEKHLGSQSARCMVERNARDDCVDDVAIEAIDAADSIVVCRC
jgi:hypothetical protein